MSATFQPDGAPPAKSTSTTKVIVIVLAVLFILGLLVCGGIASLMYFGFDRFQELAGEEFKEQLVGNPVIEEELGEIQSMKMDLQTTTTRAQEHPGKQAIVFQVDGSRADGTLIAEMDNRGNNRIERATLETEDGRTVEIPLGNISLDDSPPEEAPFSIPEPDATEPDATETDATETDAAVPDASDETLP